MKRLRLGLQGKFAISLVVMLLAIVGVVTTIIAVQYRSRMEKVYSDAAFDMASYAAKILDADKIRTYYKTGRKDAYYEEMRTLLLRAKQSFGVKYFYVVVPERDQMVYIWDVGEPGEKGVCDLLDRDDYYGGGNELMHAAFVKDAPHTILVTRNEEYGYLASAYLAILDKSGVPVALASVDVSMDEIDAQINGMILISAGFAVGILVLCLIGYWWCIRRIVIEPLDTLAGAARNFTSEREHGEGLVMDKVRISSKDEIGDLYAAMSKMEIDMTNYLDNLRKVTAERERVGAELNVAKQIQADKVSGISFSGDDLVLFGSYFAINPRIRAYTRTLLQQAHDAGAILYYDINFRKSHIADLPDTLGNIVENCRLSDIVRGSDEDFGYLFGTEDPVEIYERHISPLCSTFICTCGGNPVHVFVNGEHCTFPVLPVETISTIGAGDNFNAGFLYAMLALGIRKGALAEADWKSMTAIAGQFSAEVCRSMFNYVGKEFKVRL